MKDLFPDLFLLSLVKDAIVASYIERMEGGSHHWNPTFMHAYSGLGIGVSCLLYTNFPLGDGEDKIVLEVFLAKKVIFALSYNK